MILAAVGDGKSSKGSTKRSQEWSDSRPTDQAAEPIYVPAEDVLADVGGKMVVTDELRDSSKDRPGRRDEGVS
jgi:hypothetical protein